VHSSIYLNRNHKVSIADGLQKKWLVMRHLFHITIILTQLTHSMKQNHSWEANSHSTSQETLHLSWNLKVHYSVYKSPSWAKYIHFILSHPISPRSILILSSHQ
jgi:hypothetical protein